MNTIQHRFRSCRFELASLLSLVLQGVSCAAPIEEVGTKLDTTDQSETSQPLYFASGNLWGRGSLPVCWATSDTCALGAPYAIEKEWVREAVTGQLSWQEETDITFTGWGDCPSNFSNGIKVMPGWCTAVTRGIGRGSPTQVLLDFEPFDALPSGGYIRCSENGLDRQQCIQATALHEFGHAIGIAHENNRPGLAAGCNDSQGNGDTTIGAFDPASIMMGRSGSCNTPLSWFLSSVDRKGADRMYRQRRGDPRRLGYYNNDSGAHQRADLLCHDVRSGEKSIDYADDNGHLSGIDWSTGLNWCGHDSGKLYHGDFNGDEADDLLCADINTGQLWVDYASGSGRFHGDDPSPGFNCGGTAAVFVGDFDGNGFDDLLCHTTFTDNPFNAIFYSDDPGMGAWQETFVSNWCTHPTGRLMVGDFNGDSRDDLLCFDVASGEKWFDYAESGGVFNGNDLNTADGWCGHETGDLHIADFNGDGRDDLLCHDVVNGNKWIDYANINGQFWGTEWFSALNWCQTGRGLLYTGDLNGDGRDDMLCHDPVAGQKWVYYATTSGAFDPAVWPGWYINSGFCEQPSGQIH